MAKQLNVDMRFTADTSNAKAQLQDLQSQLDKLTKISTSTSGFGLTDSIKQATIAATQLKEQLTAATNVNTGTLDLSKFSESLRKSGMSLSQYETQLSKLGPEGSKAFATLAQSIATAEIPLKRSNAMLNEFFTTLKNTARWQISSSILHGFMGTLSSAQRYAQDLNESLNNIRIVTGQSVDQMSRFAAEANKAARELNTTTTAYTDAALIYYQQGLNDEEVAGRTEVTIKLANAAGESAQKVSDQLTAVWNNFYDGSHSLEYYADVMTALGAATASSTDEISDGLEKFASVAQSIGLSYDYAASALATVTATTRQSADVVGTAFKTLFSRIQGLKLGETLEDGTDLNKYSAALQSVGVSIKDENGELRDMDVILDDLGEKWNLLARDQKVALAQTVAGVRQYNQMMALMENWDFFQENLLVARGSEGELTRQAQVFGDSWEAARKRVQASAEAIYGALIDDDFFIGVDNMVSGLLDTVNRLITGFGGLPGIISLLGVTLTTVFGSQLSHSIDDMLTNIKLKTALGRQELIQLKEEANKKLVDMTQDTNTTSGKIASMAYQSQGSAQSAVLEKQLDLKVRMSAEEEKITASLLEQHNALVQNTIAAGKELEVQEQLYNKVSARAAKELEKGLAERQAGFRDLEAAGITGSQKITIDVTPGANNDAVFAKLRAALDETNKAAADAGQTFKDFANFQYGGEAGEWINRLRVALSKTNVDAVEVQRALNAIANVQGPDAAVKGYNDAIASLDKLKNQYAQVAAANNQFANVKFDTKDIDSYRNKIEAIKQQCKDAGMSLSQAFGLDGAKALGEFRAALDKTGQVTEADLNKLKSALGAALDGINADIETQFTQISASLKSALGEEAAAPIIESIRQAFDNLADSERVVTENSEALSNSQATLKQYLATVKGEATTVGQALIGLGTAAASLASIFNTLKGVVDIWNDDDATLMQKITTSMTALGTVTFAASRAYSALNKIKLKDLADTPKHVAQLIIAAAAEKKKAAATAAAGAASGAAVAPEVAHAASTAAEGAAAAAATPSVAALAGAVWTLLAPLLPVIIAIGAVTAAIGYFVTQDKKAREEIHKTAETAREHADALRDSAEATKEQADEYEAALKNYKEAKKAFEEGTGSADELKNAQENLNSIAKELTTTLDIQGLSLAELTGNYDDLTRAIRGATKEQLEQASESLKIAQSTTGNEFITSMYEGKGHRVDGGYKVDFGAHAIEAGKLDDYLTGDEQYLHKGLTGFDAYVSDYKNLDQMIGAYEEIQAFYDKVASSGDISLLQTHTMTNIAEWLEKSREYYNLYIQYGEQIKAIQLEITSLNEDIALTLESVSTQEEYASAREKLLQSLAEERGLTEEDAEGWAALEQEVDAYLGTLANTAPYAQVEKALTELADKTHIAKEEIEEFRKTLDDEQLEQFFQADFQPGTTTEDWERQINRGVRQSRISNLETQRSTAASGIELFNNKKTSPADIRSWAEGFDFSTLAKTMNLGDFSIVDFLSLSSEEQQEVLSSYQYCLDMMLATEKQTEIAIEQSEAESLERRKAALQQKNAEEAAHKAELLRELASLQAQSDAELTEAELARQEELLTRLANIYKEQYESIDEAKRAFSDIDTVQAEAAAQEELAGAYAALLAEIEKLSSATQQYESDLQYLALSAESLASLNSMSLSQDEYSMGLMNLANQYENCTEEAKLYSQALRGNNEELKAAAEDNLRASIYAAELGEACDVAAEDIENYADALKDSGKFANASSKALVEIAKDQARFDRAVESSIKNYDNWLEELQIGEKTGVVAASTMKELRSAYGDLLDIDGENFSSSFLKSAENLELMRQALEGSEEAYQQLQQMAGQEILAHIGLDTSQYFTDLNNVISTAEQCTNQKWADIEAGASLNDQAFLDELTRIVNAANMTAQQATDYLSSMGVDAEVVEQTETQPTTSVYTGATAHVMTQQVPGTDPLTGQPKTYQVPSIWYTANTTEVPGQEQITGFGLKVVSANKSSGGAVKAGGSAPLAGNGGSARPAPKGGGGGGGGSKEKEIKHADGKKDSEKERYHTLRNQLEDLSAAYDRVSKASDRAFGKDKLKLIDGEIQATDELIQKQEEYLRAIKAYLPQDKAIMEAYAQKLLGFGIQYDESGNIQNFDALQDAMYATYNARAAAMDSESTEWQVFEKEFEELEHWIEQYEETYDLLRDEEDKMQELLDQKADAQLKKIQYAIELKLNIADDGLAVLEYQLENLEDKAFSAAESIALMGEKVDLLYDKVAADREGLDKILGQQLSSAEIRQFYDGDMSVLQGKHFTEEQVETIKEYRDNLLELNRELLDVRKAVQEEVMETFDEFNDKLEDQIDLFDHYNAILENYKNIIDIVGKSYLKVDRELLRTLNQATINNAINKVKGTKDAYDALVLSQQAAENALRDAIARGNEIDIEAWEKDLEEIQKRVNEAQEEMMQAWEDSLQSCAEMFELAVEDAIDNFEKAMLPFGSLEEFQDAYDKQKEVADQYLDDYDKIYELSKLARNVNNSINDAPNIAGKQKLAKLLEKINGYQEDGVQMSEYELEYLQKEYDLRLAEIALEEAQNAKSVVRLTRDNEGNYSYSYTADTSAVDDAAQKYEDALHAMQELSSNYIDDMSDQLIDATQQMEEELAAVRVQDYASIEDYYKKIDEIQQYWLDRMGYMQGEFQKALDNNKTLYEQDWQRYADATGYKISADEDFAKSYQDTVLGKLFDSEDDIIDFQERVNDALGTSDSGLIGELLQAYLDWQQNTENAMVAAGTSTEGFAEHMDNAVNGPDGIVDASNDAVDATRNLTDQMVSGFTTVIGAVDAWQSHYSKTMDDIIAKNMSVIEAHNLLVKALSNGDTTTSTSGSSSPGGSAYQQSTNSGGSSNSSAGSSGSIGGVGVTGTDGNNADLSKGSYVDVKSGTKWYADSWGGSPWGWARSGTIMYTAEGSPLAYNIEGLGWIKKSDIVGYDTGGYTGDWGVAGRLAMLHEKELVLNAEDTENFLSAIEMVRDISRMVDLQAQWQSTGLGSLIASAIKDTDQTLQQEVNIHAEFPSVTDHNEIEQAFNNLINTASQYANRKNPLSGLV